MNRQKKILNWVSILRIKQMGIRKKKKKMLEKSDNKEGKSGQSTSEDGSVENGTPSTNIMTFGAKPLTDLREEAIFLNSLWKQIADGVEERTWFETGTGIGYV
jgi:hypothetical protein